MSYNPRVISGKLREFILIINRKSIVLNWARNKIPPLHSVSSFYATIVFLLYGWTSFVFLWKLPGWLYFLNFEEIAVIGAYILVTSLFQSLVVLFLFLFASLVLPSRWLSSKFLVRASILIYSFTFWVALFDLKYGNELPTRADLLAVAVGFPLTVGLGSLLTNKISFIKTFLNALADRLVVFLYLWIPLSVIAVIIVILRLV
jgi:hypothetical protein